MSLDQIKHLIGDLARPYCLIATGTATAWAIFDGKGADIITAAGMVLMVLYGAKAAEMAVINRGRRTTDQQPEA